MNKNLEFQKYQKSQKQFLNFKDRILKSCEDKNSINNIFKLIDIFNFHHKFQTKEFNDRCNKLWDDN